MRLLKNLRLTIRSRLVRQAMAVALTAVVLFAPVSVAALGPFQRACEVGGASSVVCQGQNQTDNPVVGTGGVMLKVADLIATVTAIAAVIMIVIAGIRLVLSNGDSQAIQGSRNQAIYAIVGLIITLIAKSIIAFVINHIN